ncbi:hypothetical protein [Tsukamurella pulmonis]|uniref:hypothetical protein n=1 Tax=Tsukamurella pulmonis TaxID=47312 RepID=UPI0014025387|nr:hypothetical protein [Tsukamurella pulmonis]
MSDPDNTYEDFLAHQAVDDASGHNAQQDLADEAEVIASGIDRSEREIAAQQKAHENRLRRLAAHHGLVIEKCRVRSTEIPWRGTYRIVNATNNTVEYGHQWANSYGLSLEDIEAYLTQ